MLKNVSGGVVTRKVNGVFFTFQVGEVLDVPSVLAGDVRLESVRGRKKKDFGRSSDLADVNGDGVVDFRDVITVAKRVFRGKKKK